MTPTRSSSVQWPRPTVRAAQRGGERGRPRPRFLVLMLGLAAVGLLISVGSAEAATVLRGRVVRIDERETLTEDLYVFGGAVEVLGSARRDVVLVAGLANVVGPVEGSLTVAAGRAEVRGAIAGSVRGGGAALALYGSVAGDLVVAAGSLTVVEGATIAGDLIVTGGTATLVEGSAVGGDVRGSMGNLTIEGEVGGEVDVSVSQLQVTDGARIDGAVRYRSDRPAEIGAEAVIAGAVTRAAPTAWPRMGGAWAWAGAALPRLLALAAAGIVALLVLPRRTVAVADRVRVSPLAALAVGLGAAVFGPVAVALLAITVVAIPVAAIVAAGYVGAAYLSQVFVGLALGRLIMRMPRGERHRLPNLLAMAIGVVLLGALRLIPVPYLDLIVTGLITMLGIGAAASALVHSTPTSPHRRSPAARLASA